MKPPRRRLRLWHWIVGGLFVMAVALAIGFPIWLRSTADIDAFQERARARGIATTWEEVAAERPFDPERAAIFQELIHLVDGVQSWGELDPDNTIIAGEPPPEALREHHEAFGPQFWPQISDLIRQLDGQPVVMHESIEFVTPLPEIAAMRRLNNLLREAWLLDEIAVEVLLDQPDLLESISVISGLIRASLRQTALRSLLQRPPGELSDRARARLEGWASQAQQEIAAIFKYEFIGSLTGIWSPSGFVSEAAGFGIEGYRNMFRYRWSRPASLNLMSEVVTAAQAGPGIGEQAQAFQRLGGRIDAIFSGNGGYRYALAGLLIPALFRSHRALVSQALTSAVVLHELGHAPWPEDPFAPPGTPLRRHERNGILIGAWSVGWDGVDHGGLKDRDFIIELRPPWDAPSSSP